MTNAETVTKFISLIEHKEIEAAVALTTPDISYENMPMQPIVGHEGLRSTLQMFLAPATTVDWQILSQHEVDSIVINERLDRFKIGDGWLELPIAGIFHFGNDGKISIWRDYFDMQTYTKGLAKLTAS